MHERPVLFDRIDLFPLTFSGVCGREVITALWDGVGFCQVNSRFGAPPKPETSFWADLLLSSLLLCDIWRVCWKAISRAMRTPTSRSFFRVHEDVRQETP